MMNLFEMKHISSQHQINQICETLKHNGQEITIAKVYKFLNNNASFIDIADKVILYKKNLKKAQEVAKNEIVTNLPKASDLDLIIEKIVSLNSSIHHDHKQLTLLNLKMELKYYINSKINNKIHKYKLETKKIRQKNDHIEVNFYGMQAQLIQLKKHQKLLKEENYLLQQKLRKIQTQKEASKENTNLQHKIVQVRDYKTQMNLLKTDCCATYDLTTKSIVVKIPPKHRLEREFQKGINSIYLRSNAVYDFSTKYWFLDQFEARTINLLIRNNFVISAELAYILQKLPS